MPNIKKDVNKFDVIIPKLPVRSMAKWYIYDKFIGLNTKDDPEKVQDGQNVGGQNTTCNNGDRISVRKLGYQLFSDLTSYGSYVNKSHAFKKMNGDNIFMYFIGIYLLYYNKISETVEVLSSIFTSGQKQAICDFNDGSSATPTSWTYFTNQVNGMYRWNGSYGTIASATSTTLTLNSTSLGTTWGKNGFASSPETIGDTTTQYDITNTSGNTWRYTWTTTGTNPELSTTLCPVGTTVFINGSGFNNLNIGIFTITNIQTNYFEITNPNGGAQSGVTIGTNGLIQIDYNYSKGEAVIIGGVSYSYKGGAYTNILTGVDALPSITAGTAVAQSIVKSTNPVSSPIINPFQIGGSVFGNRLFTMFGRLFVFGVQGLEHNLYGSEIFDATNFTLAATADTSSPIVLSLVEGGGGISDVSGDEELMYIEKESIIYSWTGNYLDEPVPLKPFDNKSQNIGAIAGTTFVGANYTFLITPDNQLISLQRLVNVNYPQIVPISDIIKNTFVNSKNDQANGIVFQNYAYITTKNNNQITFNNQVYVWDIQNQIWDNPISGWNVTDFTIYKDSDTQELYFSDSNAPYIWKVTNTPNDNVIADTSNYVSALWPSKQFTFGMPENMKECDNLFIEGYIYQNTNLDIQLLVDEDGYTQKFSTTLQGTETNYLFVSPDITNPAFGNNPFGFVPFGGNSQINPRIKFRVYLNKGVKIKNFYNLQLIFSSNDKNQLWEVTSFGFHVGIADQEFNQGLFRTFI